jgi:hypothetical protein
VLHQAAACARSAGPTVAEEVASTLIQEWKGASVLFLVDYFELRSFAEDRAHNQLRAIIHAHEPAGSVGIK